MNKETKGGRDGWTDKLTDRQRRMRRMRREGKIRSWETPVLVKLTDEL